jgi:hypothetical protein
MLDSAIIQCGSVLTVSACLRSLLQALAVKAAWEQQRAKDDATAAQRSPTAANATADTASQQQQQPSSSSSSSSSTTVTTPVAAAAESSTTVEQNGSEQKDSQKEINNDVTTATAAAAPSQGVWVRALGQLACKGDVPAWKQYIHSEAHRSRLRRSATKEAAVSLKNITNLNSIYNTVMTVNFRLNAAQQTVATAAASALSSTLNAQQCKHADTA